MQKNGEISGKENKVEEVLGVFAWFRPFPLLRSGKKGVKSILYKNLQYFHLWEKL